jgi:hypothetical protein
MKFDLQNKKVLIEALFYLNFFFFLNLPPTSPPYLLVLS